MAAAPSVGDLDYLWRPKRTLRDWGQTSYNIVCNWTPHYAKAPQPSNSQKITKSSTNKKSATKSLTTNSLHHSATEEGTRAQTSFQGETDSTTYRLRRSTRRQTSNSSNATWNVPDEQLGRRRQSSASSADHSHNDSASSVDLDVIGDTAEKQQIETSISSCSQSPPPLQSLTDSYSREMPGPGQDDVDLPPCVGEKDSGVYEREEEERMSVPVDRVNDQETEEMDCAGEDHIVSDNTSSPVCESQAHTSSSTDTRKNVHKKSKTEKVSGKGKGRKAATKQKRKKKTTDENQDSSIKVKTRSTRSSRGASRCNLGDLDSRLNVYERIIEEAQTEEGEGRVEKALVSHWKGTQKQIMSIMKDLHADLANEKRSKGRVKQGRLKREMLTSLKQLRKNNEVYHEALSKTKHDRQKREIESIEAQIAAVGLQLQSNC